MLNFLNDLLWGKVLIFALIAVGLVFTLASRFVQFRYFLRMFAILGQVTHREEGHLSSFQALVLSVAGRVGAGNIAGVAVAITLGGPGAVFWMWVIGLVGMSTSFFECTLAQVYKVAEPDGTFRGGPAYYIDRGLGNRALALVFSALLLITFGFGFNALQSYTVATSVQDTFGIPTSVTGVVLLVVLGLIIFGGVKRIAEVSEFIVPIMAVGYFAMALFVILTNLDRVPQVLGLIFSSAFGLNAALAGGFGAALMFGVKRGLFSNEAGLGSAPNVAAVAYVPHPVNQGIVQAFSVFIDTIILCSCTAALILLSPVYAPGSDLGGVTLTQAAMADHVGEWGRVFVTIALLMFAFTSILYNYYLGENSLNFFSEGDRWLFLIFRVMTLALVVWGAAQDLSTVFGFADVTMGLLALVNLFAVVMLFKVGLVVMRNYDQQLKAGVATPVFDPSEFPGVEIDGVAWPSLSPVQTFAPALVEEDLPPGRMDY
ncbi:MAG TPA: alanine:cation symporter family protein [Leptolyngbyaceae cyanobacterium M65_K2018_010]|nr:alanine:cation symporter family protein [Leptolyngbyaceae cyanobacterium M65_K2018_010]